VNDEIHATGSECLVDVTSGLHLMRRTKARVSIKSLNAVRGCLRHCCTVLLMGRYDVKMFSEIHCISNDLFWEALFHETDKAEAVIEACYYGHQRLRF